MELACHCLKFNWTVSSFQHFYFSWYLRLTQHVIQCSHLNRNFCRPLRFKLFKRFKLFSLIVIRPPLQLLSTFLFSSRFGSYHVVIVFFLRFLFFPRQKRQISSKSQDDINIRNNNEKYSLIQSAVQSKYCTMLDSGLDFQRTASVMINI